MSYMNGIYHNIADQMGSREPQLDHIPSDERFARIQEAAQARICLEHGLPAEWQSQRVHCLSSRRSNDDGE